MICVTVTPSSRQLAKVDLLNAAKYGDVIELCLDHLTKEPDVKDLISAVSKPVIISCRRKQDGGAWEGSEEARLTLLRRAIVAGPAYIELDFDVAPGIPRFGDTKRIISFTRLDRPEHDIEGVFDEASNQQADVVKFTWPTPTLDDAWPLLRAVSGKRPLPIVGLGLGRADLTFSLLGRKYGSPWIYAALERGMEAFEGQATVFELDEVYHWRDIDKSTTFVAVAGFGDSQTMTTRVLNAGFTHLGMNVRCLPIEIGEIGQLRKMLDALKVRAIIAGSGMGTRLHALADEVDESDPRSGYTDLLLKRSSGQWRGYNSIWWSGLKALEAKLGEGGFPLERRNVLVLGTGGAARALVFACQQRKGLVSISGPRDAQAQQVANQLGCRFVPFHNVYDTLFDVVVIADPDLRCGVQQGCVNPSLFRSTMTVLDVSDPPAAHPLLEEARERECRVVEPVEVFTGQAGAQFKAITREELPASAAAIADAAE
ncbi:MAG: type I 3-dehydroquinate dehydratase [Planctomycetota bacterium]|nr:MAG: type I 3-dehydroquinate dehydratase [Planctomycetota bacterium]REK25218.1 MAG: type I 3-dehydroquinate dehydratase [Planctomycetota bacterium]REK32118.1 MAG: type I 3-dehydroquinate dehydratase [Planctomycetota bacterium]